MTQEEATVLLLSILRRPAEDSLPPTRPVPPAQEWPDILACAKDQNVAPFVYAQLQRTGRAKAAPEPVLRELQRCYHQNSARNLRLFHELKAILDKLAILRTPVIILKGAFLASAVYANPAMRTIGDLDILIPAAAIPATMGMLRELGYRPVQPPWVNAPGQVALATPSCLTELDMHWEFTDPNIHSRIPVERVWDTSVPLEIAGCKALALAPEELLLHLCYHTATKHLFVLGIRSLIDVDETVRHNRNRLDWERVVSLATDWGSRKAVGLTLQLCRQQLDTPVPDSVLERLEITDINPEIVQAALMQVSLQAKSNDASFAHAVQVQTQQGLLGKMEIFVEFILRPLHAEYGIPGERGPWTTLYYTLRRLMYLIGNYAPTIWHLSPHSRDGIEFSYPKRRLVEWLYS